jgi:hypothetical protein
MGYLLVLTTIVINADVAEVAKWVESIQIKDKPALEIPDNDHSTVENKLAVVDEVWLRELPHHVDQEDHVHIDIDVDHGQIRLGVLESKSYEQHEANVNNVGEHPVAVDLVELLIHRPDLPFACLRGQIILLVRRDRHHFI